MRRTVPFLATVIVYAAASAAQLAAPPQTARQALLEMFFSKDHGTLVKHLPKVTLEALEKAGALTALQQYSAMTGQMEVHSQSQHLETFETGSKLMTWDDSKTGQKIEIRVESDTLQGDHDDIALSFKTYKDGQPQHTTFMPQVVFSMKQEDNVWRLNEITVAIHLPLTDPDLLKAITDKMKPQAVNSALTFQRSGTSARPQNTSPQIPSQPIPPTQNTAGPIPAPQGWLPMQPAGSDATVLAAMRTIVTAEATYASRYPRVGYTCTLSDLDGFGGGEPNEHQAMLIPSGLASGKRYGYIFTLTGCARTPAAGFQLMAAPNANTLGRKAFCADQAGTIRSSTDGKPESCLASGEPVQ